MQFLSGGFGLIPMTDNNTITVRVDPDRLELVDATVLPHSGGDLAAGSVRVTMEIAGTELTYEVDYDTRPGKDGLRTEITDSPGDTVTVWSSQLENRVHRELPEKAHKAAVLVFSYMRGQAVTAKQPQTGVCFAKTLRVKPETIEEVKLDL